MTPEEKARAYDEAFNRAKEKYHAGCLAPALLEYIFPEIKENEDERVRKELLEHCKKQAEIYNTLQKGKEYGRRQSWIDWLEKQGEQKFAWSEDEIEKAAQEWDSKASVTPFYMTLDGKGSPNGVRQDIMTHKESFKAGINWILKFIKGEKPLGKTALEAAKEAKIDNVNKVEPKVIFHKGDWIICEVTGSVYQIKDCIENLSNHKYGYDLTNGDYISGDEVNHYHLWTIQEARNGDVLVNGSNIFIFSHLSDTRTMGYCHVNLDDKKFYDDRGTIECFGTIDAVFTPATKEQRAYLFAKMSEAGYEWNEDDKELNKIPNALEECKIEHGQYYYCIKDYYSGGCKRASKGEVVQALRGLDIMSLGVKANEYFLPVKRIVDTRSNWSNEDSFQVEFLTALCEDQQIDSAGDSTMHRVAEEAKTWLKSIKDRIHSNDIWHSADEEPLDNGFVFVEWAGPLWGELMHDLLRYSSDKKGFYHGKVFLSKDKISRWAYVEDLVK